MATLGTSDNDNEPWSEMEIADLRSGLGFGASIEEIAAFLLRDPEEVRQKVRERSRGSPSSPTPGRTGKSIGRRRLSSNSARET
jgi:hypothetical protein